MQFSDRSCNLEYVTLTVTLPNNFYPNPSLLDILKLGIDYFRKEVCLHFLEISSALKFLNCTPVSVHPLYKAVSIDMHTTLFHVIPLHN